MNEHVDQREPCVRCLGAGDVTCPRCGGFGWETAAREVESDAQLVYDTAVMTMERADMMHGVSMRELFDDYLRKARESS